MRSRDLPMRLFRATMIVVAVSCVAAATPLPAQQATDSALVAPASSAQASAASTAALPGPRLAPRYQRVEPRVAPTNSRGSAFAAQGGGNTIVISTLGLVLILLIIVLLLR